MSTITRLSQDMTQYYKIITSPIGANARIQRDIIMNGARDVQELQKKTQEMSREFERIGLRMVNC